MALKAISIQGCPYRFTVSESVKQQSIPRPARWGVEILKMPFGLGPWLRYLQASVRAFIIACGRTASNLRKARLGPSHPNSAWIGISILFGDRHSICNSSSEKNFAIFIQVFLRFILFQNYSNVFISPLWGGKRKLCKSSKFGKVFVSRILEWLSQKRDSIFGFL